jgi:hypothetical protein
MKRQDKGGLESTPPFSAFQMSDKLVSLATYQETSSSNQKGLEEALPNAPGK